MLSPQRIEQRVFLISLWAGVVFVVVEVLMAAFSRSQTVLMDAAYDGAELAVIAVSLLLTPLFYRPISEKRPFGFFQCENLFIIIKGCMMLSVTGGLMMSNLQLMLDGGRMIDSRQVAGFEALLAGISLLVLMVLRYYAKQVDSPSAAAELYGWKVDFLSSAGIAVAFWAAPLLGQVGLGWLTPYFDQLVALILVLFVLPGPVQMILTAFRELLLFAPKGETMDAIRAAVSEELAAADFGLGFLEATQTGRKIWVTVTFAPQGEVLEMRTLRALQQQLGDRLHTVSDCIELELIPEQSP